MAIGEIDSILGSVKKKLGMDPETMTEFDLDVVDAINMALSTLTQLGVGPSEGYSIHGSEETWSDFLQSKPVESLARSYIYIETRLLFDPPQTSYVINELQEKSKELAWRLNTYAEIVDSFPEIKREGW